jgi:hypothetical protein
MVLNTSDLAGCLLFSNNLDRKYACHTFIGLQYSNPPRIILQPKHCDETSSDRKLEKPCPLPFCGPITAKTPQIRPWSSSISVNGTTSTFKCKYAASPTEDSKPSFSVLSTSPTPFSKSKSSAHDLCLGIFITRISGFESVNCE